jgi:L-asparaginase/Glu-tRNA(Gln) amidotransferase subunit D
MVLGKIKNIVIITTGGTISQKYDKKSSTLYEKK